MSDSSLRPSLPGHTPEHAPNRHARRRVQTRQALLAAGERLFSRAGYQATTVAQVAREADVGVGTFYLHFRDKDELAETIVREGLLALRDALAARLAGVPPQGRLSVMLREILRHAHARPDLFRIALTTRGTLAMTRRAQAWLAEQIAAALAAEAASGSGEDHRLTGRLLAGMVTQAIAWWQDEAAPGPDAMADHILQLIGRGEAGERV
jgi:AcrR family transcriptional regulator